jgi:cell division GTPase FtsZ
VQINFGVILNESLADAVKITVIATGFQPDLPEPAAAPPPVPAPPAPPIVDRHYPEPEPELMADAEPMLDLDDVETPAYLRQGRLLN